jgi:hypothetical protein
MNNETAYLFALSSPDLLERLVALMPPPAAPLPARP